MNGPHDMGGMQGFGPVNPTPEAEETLFHAEWERRTFALIEACGFLGEWTLDEGRFARESMTAERYLGAGYYEKWLDALSRQLCEKGLIAPSELATGKSESRVAPDRYRVLKGAVVDQVFLKIGSSAMPTEATPAFAVGDTVRARRINPAGHTRSPRYLRGCVGEVALHHGGHIFADANAHGDKRGEHLYTVRFAARELWGAGSFNGAVMADLWEPHLERP